MTDSPAGTDPSSTRKLPRSVKIVGLASLLNDTASEMIYPLLPHFLITVLMGNRFALGVIEGIADCVASLVKLWSGSQSDRAGGRKGFILFGYSVPALVRPVMGLITAPWQLFTIRILDRIGKGVRSSPRDALIAESTDHTMRGQAFGFQRAMDNLGAAIGPLLAAIFLWFWPEDLRTLFLISVVPGLLVVLLLIFGLREERAVSPPSARMKLSVKHLDRNFRVYLWSLLVFTLGNSSDAFLLVRAGELGVQPVMLPLLWCACHIAKSSGNIVLGRVIDRIGSHRSLLLGWFAFAAVYLAFGLASTTWEIWVCFVAYGLACGLIEPAERALVAQLVGSEKKGFAYGWYNFAIGIATLPSSLIFGAIYQFAGPLAAFAWGGALAIGAAILLTRVPANPTKM